MIGTPLLDIAQLVKIAITVTVKSLQDILFAHNGYSILSYSQQIVNRVGDWPHWNASKKLSKF